MSSLSIGSLLHDPAEFPERPLPEFPELTDDLRERVGDEAYEAIADDRAAPRSDVGAIYNARKLRHLDRAFVEVPRGAQPGSVTDAVLNVALRLVLQPHDAPTPFQLLALHWLSRRRTHHRAERVNCAGKLRTLMTDAGSPPSVALGDFNDEPFDTSIVEHLAASRDHDLVVRHPNQHLYNPTWRLMGPRASGVGVEREPLPSTVGSHFFTGPDAVATNRTRWYVFDQVIASAQMLGGSAYRLLDDRVTFWSAPWLLRPSEGLVQGFDHLPILATLRYAVTSPSELPV